MYKDVIKPEVIKGVKSWVNPANGFKVIMLHYSADPEKDPDREGKEWYDNERKGMPKDKWNKEMEIDFATKAGKLIYGKEFCDFDPSIHLINSFEIDRAEFLIGLDFGQRNPTCTLVGAWTKDNILYIIDEYYKPALPSVSSREMFEQFSYLVGDARGKGFGEKRRMADAFFQLKLIDPTTCSKNRSKIREGEEIEYSVIEEFYDNGWDFEPAKNDVDSGITRVREYFQLDASGKAHLYIFKDKCPHLCNEIQKYRYKELSDAISRQNNESETPVKKDDHACDCLRYLCMSRPHNPSEAPVKKTFIQQDIENIIKPKIYNFNDDSN